MIASAPGRTGRAVALNTGQAPGALRIAGLDHRGAQALEPVRGYAGFGKAVQLQDFGQRARAPRGTHCLLPFALGKFGDHGLQFVARGELGLLHRALGDLAVGEVLEAVTHAPHVKAFQLERLQAAPDDELGRAAADVDDQPLVLGHGQAVRHATIDQARFLASRHDFNRESKRGLGLLEETGRILGHPQRVGADRAHRMRVEPAQALAKPPHAVERAGLRIFVQAFLAVEAGAETDRLAQRIQRVDLVTDDTRNLQVERVGTEIDCGEGGVNRHVIWPGLPSCTARRLLNHHETGV